MTESVDHVAALSVSEGIELLAGRLHQLRGKLQSDAHAEQDFLRLEVALSPIDPLLWLRELAVDRKFYWHHRDCSQEVAAVGTADELTGGDLFGADIAGLMKTIRERMKRLTAARYYGGISFDLERAANSNGDGWHLFGPARFFLPRFELRKAGDSHALACHVRRSELPTINLEDTFAMLSPSRAIESSPTRLDNRLDLPDMSSWRSHLQHMGDQFSSGSMEKLVLARRTTFDTSDKLDPWRIVENLLRDGDNCFVFCFQPVDGTAFVGATPERLFSREGLEVESEAIAGTRPRGKNDIDDATLAHDLTMSEKDLREHRFVITGIDRALAPLCERLAYDAEPSVLKLTRVQHLITRFRGRLHEGVTDGALLAALHPTPAVGGSPGRKAIQMIGELEAFNRGWYAGPVGWLSQEESEFAVSLRCGLIHKDKLSLFSGAGLVAGSDPEKEWQEVESKIKTFIAAVSD